MDPIFLTLVMNCVLYYDASVLRPLCQVLHGDIHICFYELTGRIERSTVEAVSESCLGPAELFAVDYALNNFYLCGFIFNLVNIFSFLGS